MTSLEDKNPAILENLHDNYAEIFYKKLGYLRLNYKFMLMLYQNSTKLDQFHS